MNEISKISPWSAKPLSEAAKDRHFRAVMDLSAERVLLGRSAIITGWVIGVVGVAFLTASAIGWVAILPLKTVETQWYMVDKSTGIISKPVSLEDAPRVFGEVNDAHYLRTYIQAREGWVPEMDEQNDRLAKIMSTPDEQARIAEARNLPLRPQKALGKDGHSVVENFRFHPLETGKSGTRSYLVQFDLTIWRGSIKEPTKPYSATVNFQWHPELPMTPDVRSLNPGGFQVISYSANPDKPDIRRQ
jgi:type IV secretion system protein VirB8